MPRLPVLRCSKSMCFCESLTAACLVQVSTSNLERVRRIKNRLVRLTTRVQTLREMLEKLMDDDSDMHAMHLTARAYDQLERQAGLQPYKASYVQLLGFLLVLLLFSVYALQSLLESLHCLYGIPAISRHPVGKEDADAKNCTCRGRSRQDLTARWCGSR